MNIIDNYKKQADLAVEQYINCIEQNEEENQQTFKLNDKDKKALITQLSQNDVTDTEQSSIKYEEQQFEYFAKLNKNKTSKCVVCKKINPKYKCPKCRVEYCSIEHFRSHNLFCTQRFFKDQVQSQLKATKVNKDVKKKMVEILKNNKEEIEKDSTKIQESITVQEIKEERLKQLLQVLEREEEVNLTENERKCFQNYLKEIKIDSQSQGGLEIGQSAKQKEEPHHQFEQYQPFWLIQEGLSQYFIIGKSIEIEQYNTSEHKQLLNYRQLSSQLLRQDLQKLLENISFKKTSVFINFQLLQIIYLAALLFRSFNGDYLKNEQFVDTFLEIYDQNFGKKIAQTFPSTSIQILKEKVNFVNIIKTNLSHLQNKNIQIHDIVQTWVKVILQDCKKIVQNKYLCLQTLLRILQSIKSLSENPEVKWSDEVMYPDGKNPQKKTKKQKQKQKTIKKFIKKVEFLMCYVSEIAFKQAQAEGENIDKIRTFDNKSFITNIIKNEIQSEQKVEETKKQIHSEIEYQKQRKLNEILIP